MPYVNNKMKGKKSGGRSAVKMPKMKTTRKKGSGGMKKKSRS